VYLKILDVPSMKLSEILVKMANKIIYSPVVKEMARKMPNYFTRNRKMTFEDLMMFMLFHSKCSIPSSFCRFFKAKEEMTTVSQQSLSEARDKLTVETFGGYGDRCVCLS